MSKSSITTNAKNGLEPLHPGEVLLEEFLRPFGVSQYRLARDTAVPPRRINEIVHGQRSITADTALRLARFFGNSELFWLNLQARYDLDVERHRLAHILASEVVPFSASSPRERKPPRQAAAAGRAARKINSRSS